MSRTYCMGVLCPDRFKYHTLIYSITCEACFKNKMKLVTGENCKCTLIEVCDECHFHVMMKRSTTVFVAMMRLIQTASGVSD